MPTRHDPSEHIPVDGLSVGVDSAQWRADVVILGSFNEVNVAILAGQLGTRIEVLSSSMITLNPTLVCGSFSPEATFVMVHRLCSLGNNSCLTSGHS